MERSIPIPRPWRGNIFLFRAGASWLAVPMQVASPGSVVQEPVAMFNETDDEEFFFFSILNGAPRHIPFPPGAFVLTEDSGFVLTEDGGDVLTE